MIIKYIINDNARIDHVWSLAPKVPFTRPSTNCLRSHIERKPHRTALFGDEPPKNKGSPGMSWFGWMILCLECHFLKYLKIKQNLLKIPKLYFFQAETNYETLKVWTGRLPGPEMPQTLGAREVSQDPRRMPLCSAWSCSGTPHWLQSKAQFRSFLIAGTTSKKDHIKHSKVLVVNGNMMSFSMMHALVWTYMNLN